MLESSYRTGQIADLLEVSTSSIRKYAAAVEKHGTTFVKDDKGERIFTEQDLAAFRHLRKLIIGGNTMNAAAINAATLLKNDKEVRIQTGEVLANNDRELFVEMANRVETLTKQNEALVEAVHEMRRGQAHIMATLKRLEEPVKEEVASGIIEEEETKPRKWWQFGR